MKERTARIHELVESGDRAGAARLYLESELHPDDVRATLGSLSPASVAGMVAELNDDVRARELLLWLPKEHAAGIVEHLGREVAARIVSGMPSDERADLLGELEREVRAEIHALLPTAAQADAARLLTYDPDTAGGLMETEFLWLSEEMSAGHAIRELRANQERYAAIGVQYVYLLDAERRLKGVVPIRDLLLAPEGARLGTLARSDPVTVLDTMPLREVAEVFDERTYMALPVVDARGLMLGVVNRSDASEGEQEEAEDDYRVSQGIVGGEELRSMAVGMRLRRRSAWLGVNMLLCLGGAAVVVLHKETLAKAIVVAAVLPVISATSGNAAMQAAAVSIRELTLGVIDPRAWRFVLINELTLAMLMAVPLGVVVAGLAIAWGAAWTIGLAVGVAMGANAIIAIALGALCPLVLRKMRVDPALASGPITTTLADVTGFAITLSLVLVMVR